MKKLTLDTATWKVRSVTGCEVLLEMRDLIRMTSSDSRDTLKVTFTLVLLTEMSLDWSGTAEANVHSSSSLEAAVLLIGRE